MDFVIIANAWSAVSDNPTSKHQIALELARQGHRVLWIEGAGMRKPDLASSRDRSRMFQKIAAVFRGAREVGSRKSEIRGQTTDDGQRTTGRRIWVLSPLMVPLPGRAWVRRFNGWLVASLARKWAQRLGFENPVLINYVPVFAEAMEIWANHRSSFIPHRSRVVYHCVDRWDSFGTYDRELMALLDRQCCEHADVVVASSNDLYDRCRRYKANTHLVTHGVDYEHFAKALKEQRTEDGRQRAIDLPPGKLIGFFGLVSEWVDQGLLVRLAREIPRAHVVLIGKADVPTERLAVEKNIHLLGPRSFENLPAYVAQFAVGIIPFVVNDLTRAVNPIKLREMLAAGCPVVSTDLPEVGKYQGIEEKNREQRTSNNEHRTSKEDPKRSRVEGNVRIGAATATRDARQVQQLDDRRLTAVSVARDADDFVRLVRERIEAPLPLEERKIISESVRNETWKTKVREILELVQQRE